jgi:hypothetical protein
VLLLAACFSGIGFAQHALAAEVQAYALFEVASSANVSAAAEKLRGTSLGNCLQLVVGTKTRDVFLHIACDDPSYLTQAMIALSRVEGVSRATIISIRNGAD